MAAPPGVSQVPLCPIFDIKIYKEFSGIFEKLYFRGFFRNWHIDKTQKDEDEMISRKSKPSMQQL
jgi:hypothetical protein